MAENIAAYDNERVGSEISARGLGQSFGRLVVFKELNLDIERSAITLIKGESGSGKTVLLSILSSLRKPDSGRVKHGTTDITELKSKQLARWRRTVGFITQRPNVLGGLSPVENLVARSGITGKDISETTAKEMLATFGIEQFNTPVGALSGGQQQRVAIAHAMVREPRIIFADEPTAALDAANKENAHKALLQARDLFGVTVVLASHDAVAETDVDHILNLCNGTLEDASLAYSDVTNS